MPTLKKNFTPPEILGDAVKLVARIGGYLDRKNDPPPGHQLMWQGYTKLQVLCEGLALREQVVYEEAICG